MENMPYQPQLETVVRPQSQPACVITSDWRQALPLLKGTHVTLRELQKSDAVSLFAMLTSEEVSRFISPPPSTVEGFENFIEWTHRQRATGKYVCFAVVPEGFDVAIGIFQVRQTEPGFSIAEWGFAIGSPFWGTGLFEHSAELVLEFAFETLGVHRLEARAAAVNIRGNRALLKIGAVQEGLLRKSFLRNGQYHDQVLYAIVDEDWRASRQEAPAVRVH
jgi:ribosomal-protein-alanine N-acetyltransferase